MWERIRLIRGDIPCQDVDAVVNAANHTLLGGGGVDGAIHHAAGPELLAECRELHGCRTGEAKITGAGKLRAKFVIHTVGPVWYGGERNEPLQLRRCYENSLKLAAENGVRTIAFPSISTGAYGYPVKQAAPVALGAVAHSLYACPDIESVMFVLFSNDDFLVYRDVFNKLKAESTPKGRL